MQYLYTPIVIIFRRGNFYQNMENLSSIIIFIVTIVKDFPTAHIRKTKFTICIVYYEPVCTRSDRGHHLVLVHKSDASMITSLVLISKELLTSRHLGD